MPSIGYPAKILVTGAAGFLGSWVTRTLLDRGFSVRAAVRAKKDVDYLSEHLFHEETARGKLEFVLVPDISDPGVFDEVVLDVEGIIHVATNVALIPGHPNDVIKPAVDGTLGLLQSVYRYGLNVKRVILTSSIGAIARPTPDLSNFYTEEDWHTDAVARVEKEGAAAPPVLKYMAAKTLAERAAWEFVAKHKHKMRFDVTVLCPSYIFGPFIHNVRSLERISASLALFAKMVVAPPEDSKELLTTCRAAVDVRDCAAAHVDALVEEGVGGERIIVNAGSHSWQDVLDALNYPPSIEGVSLGQPDAIRPSVNNCRFSPYKAQLLLKTTFRPLSETFRDTMSPMIERGWFKTFRTSPLPSPLPSPTFARRSISIQVHQ